MTTAPSARIALVDPRLRGAWTAAGIAVVLYLALLPRALVNADEYFYAGQAYAIAHGRLAPAEGDPLPVAAGAEHQAVKYPPGWPFVLAAARTVSFRAMFLAALVAHVAGGVAFGRLLVRRNLPSWLAVVFLFHPSLWIYARTLLSDAPAAVLIVLAIDAWEARRQPAAGAALGYALLVRLASAFAAAGFVIAILGEARRRFRVAGWILAGIGAGAVIHASVNHLLTGDWFASTYTLSNATLLDGRMAAENAVLYLAGLVLLPPFSGAWVLVRAGSVDRWALAAAPVLAFGVLYGYHDESSNVIETLVGGQRLVLAAHVFLMVGTMHLWASVRWLRRDGVLAVGAMMGVIGALALRRLEDRYAPAVEAVASCGPTRIAYDMNASRVAAAVPSREYRLYDGGATPPADVLLIARRMPTNRPTTNATEWRYPDLDVLAPRCRRVGEFEIYDLAGRCPPIGSPCR